MKRKKQITLGRVILNALLIITSLGYVLPILLMISISVSTESSIIDFGYNLIPKAFSLDAYRLAFRNPTQIINSYKVTILFSVISTVLAMFVQMLTAYPLARDIYSHKKSLTIYLMITMFFSGGLVPSYILNTQYLHMGNSFWVYIWPGLMSAWNVILFKTYFKGLPDGLIEAAKLDGASEFKIFLTIIIPLSTPIIACLGFTYLLGKWNDWNTTLLYIRDNRLYSLQYLLQRIINESDYIKKMQGTGIEALVGRDMPAETLRYAIAIIAAGPMMVVFPFFQKYFAEGLVVGSVKG